MTIRDIQIQRALMERFGHPPKGRQLFCIECGAPFQVGDQVLEEMYKGVLLPPVHKTSCIEPMDERNAMRRKGTLAYSYHEDVLPECECMRCKLIRGEPL